MDMSNNIHSQVKQVVEGGVYNYNRFRPAFLPNYATAKAWYDFVPPIRGRKTDVRPVGKRSAKLTMRLDGPNEDVVITLYNTDIIRYQKDGKLVINSGGYPTETTHKELRRIAGLQVYTYQYQTWIGCVLDKRSMVMQRLPVPSKQDVVLEVNHIDARYPLNLTPTFPKKHKLNRKKVNAVRRQFKPAIDTMKGIIKLRERGFAMIGWYTSEQDMQPYVEMFGSRTEKRWKWDPVTKTNGEVDMEIPKVPLDPDHVCRAFMGSKHHKYHQDADTVAALHGEFMGLLTSDDTMDHYKALLWMSAHNPIDNPNKVIRALDRVLLRLYRDEVFEEQEVRSGKYVSDSYARYFV